MSESFDLFGPEDKPSYFHHFLHDGNNQNQIASRLISQEMTTFSNYSLSTLTSIAPDGSTNMSDISVRSFNAANAYEQVNSSMSSLPTPLNVLPFVETIQTKVTTTSSTHTHDISALRMRTFPSTDLQDSNSNTNYLSTLEEVWDTSLLQKVNNARTTYMQKFLGLCGHPKALGSPFSPHEVASHDPSLPMSASSVLSDASFDPHIQLHVAMLSQASTLYSTSPVVYPASKIVECSQQAVWEKNLKKAKEAASFQGTSISPEVTQKYFLLDGAELTLRDLLLRLRLQAAKERLTLTTPLNECTFMDDSSSLFGAFRLTQDCQAKKMHRFDVSKGPSASPADERSDNTNQTTTEEELLEIPIFELAPLRETSHGIPQPYTVLTADIAHARLSGPLIDARTQRIAEGTPVSFALNLLSDDFPTLSMSQKIVVSENSGLSPKDVLQASLEHSNQIAHRTKAGEYRGSCAGVAMISPTFRPFPASSTTAFPPSTAAFPPEDPFSPSSTHSSFVSRVIGVTVDPSAPYSSGQLSGDNIKGAFSGTLFSMLPPISSFPCAPLDKLPALVYPSPKHMQEVRTNSAGFVSPISLEFIKGFRKVLPADGGDVDLDVCLNLSSCAHASWNLLTTKDTHMIDPTTGESVAEVEDVFAHIRPDFVTLPVPTEEYLGNIQDSHDLLCGLRALDSLLAGDNETAGVYRTLLEPSEISWPMYREASAAASLDTVLMSLNSLRQGGSMVFTLDSLSTPFAISLLALLQRYFRSVHIFAPTHLAALGSTTRVICCLRLLQIRPFTLIYALGKLQYDCWVQSHQKHIPVTLCGTWLLPPATVAMDRSFLQQVRKNNSFILQAQLHLLQNLHLQFNNYSQKASLNAYRAMFAKQLGADLDALDRDCEILRDDAENSKIEDRLVLLLERARIKRKIEAQIAALPISVRLPIETTIRCDPDEIAEFYLNHWGVRVTKI